MILGQESDKYWTIQNRWPVAHFVKSLILHSSGQTYLFGASTYLTKSSSYEELKKNMEAFVIYWFEVAVFKSSF